MKEPYISVSIKTNFSQDPRPQFWIAQLVAHQLGTWEVRGSNPSRIFQLVIVFFEFEYEYIITIYIQHYGKWLITHLSERQVFMQYMKAAHRRSTSLSNVICNILIHCNSLIIKVTICDLRD